MAATFVRRLQHEGVNLLFVDLGGHDEADMLARIAAMREAIAGQPPRSALVLCDCRHAAINAAVIAALGDAVVANSPFVKASAVVGLVPKREEIRLLVAGMANSEIRSFDDPMLAMDYLAEQERAGGTA